MKSGKIIEVNDKMQAGYTYYLSAEVGKSFSEDFNPFYTPAQMLEMGVFEGKYCNDCQDEFPKSWFENAKISIRNARKDANDELKKLESISEDLIKDGEDRIQKITNEFTAKVDSTYSAKEVEIMTV